MKIEPLAITVRELVKGYSATADDGIRGYSGMLDIQPPYQREFIYENKDMVAVINTVKKGFPLNVMYWVKRADGDYEMLDGQQRTRSICNYVASREFSVDDLFFHNLQDDIQKSILDYQLMVYVCTGEDSEKIGWFETINIAGKRLNDQELRNAIYSGPWVADARRYFSRPNCAARGKGQDYLNGAVNRQDYLETAIKWISEGEINTYMALHQTENTAVDLWSYFSSVIDWVQATFTVYRKEMKGLNWGYLHRCFKDTDLDPVVLENQVNDLMEDEDVTSKSGIYTYVLTGEEKHLNIRSFTPAQRRTGYTKCKGVCAKCGKDGFDLGDMEADHITPWREGGSTTPDNLQMLCKDCNRRKSDK